MGLEVRVCLFDFTGDRGIVRWVTLSDPGQATSLSEIRPVLNHWGIALAFILTATANGAYNAERLAEYALQRTAIS